MSGNHVAVAVCRDDKILEHSSTNRQFLFLHANYRRTIKADNNRIHSMNRQVQFQRLDRQISPVRTSVSINSFFCSG